MRFKLILALAEEDRVEPVMKAAREAGATGMTVIRSARGEGMVPKKTFLGLNLTAAHDIVLFIVEENLCSNILDRIAAAGEFETRPGSGLAIQLAVEDAVGMSAQIRELSKKVEEEI
ncbi:P-II family nitrogen regulator [Pannonibacter phragmitetus]|uniref:P-II family nitrogen regulator n=1 Tax=Pannonibacter phragmitetus TaxID=121719 RepID=UPI000F02D68C|nr:P-II family nitrogen regulator [Pannonibacter phragmitetus]